MTRICNAMVFTTALFACSPGVAWAEHHSLWSMTHLDALQLWSDHCDREELEGWRFCADEDSDFCFVWSDPIFTRATRNGRAITLTRGDAALIVMHHRTRDKPVELLYMSGFSFGSDPQLLIGLTEVTLAHHHEFAFASSRAVNAEVIADMQATDTVTVVATSVRGTVLTDVFSVTGLEENLEMMAARCT